MAVLCATAGSVLYSPTAFSVSWNLSSYTSYSFGFYAKANNQFVPLSSDLFLQAEVKDGNLIGKGTLYLGWNVIDPEPDKKISVSLKFDPSLNGDTNSVSYTTSWDKNQVEKCSDSAVKWNDSFTSTTTTKEGVVISEIVTKQDEQYKSSGYLPLNIESEKITKADNYKATIILTFKTK